MRDEVLLAFFAAHATVEDYTRYRVYGYSLSRYDNIKEEFVEIEYEGVSDNIVDERYGRYYKDSVEIAKFKYAQEMLRRLKELDNSL